jgi:hypothetical protein
MVNEDDDPTRRPPAAPVPPSASLSTALARQSAATMDAAQYSALGLDVAAEDKLRDNPNGPSWVNDPATHDAPYSLGPESLSRRPGVPRGEVTEHLAWSCPSEGGVYPGVSRDWWVYVPAQYAGRQTNGGAGAHLLVFQDGAAYLGEVSGPAGRYGTPGRGVQAAVALDNLLASGDMPVCIAVFANPGVADDNPGQRSYEYDSMTPDFSTFLLQDLLPCAPPKQYFGVVLCLVGVRFNVHRRVWADYCTSQAGGTRVFHLL